jgi:hypothetical protein
MAAECPDGTARIPESEEKKGMRMSEGVYVVNMLLLPTDLRMRKAGKADSFRAPERAG